MAAARYIRRWTDMPEGSCQQAVHRGGRPNRMLIPPATPLETEAMHDFFFFFFKTTAAERGRGADINTEAALFLRSS